MADFTVTNHGSIFMLRPNNRPAFLWMRANVDTAGALMLGSAVAVEHRYIADIVAGFQAEGLTAE